MARATPTSDILSAVRLRRGASRLCTSPSDIANDDSENGTSRAVERKELATHAGAARRKFLVKRLGRVAGTVRSVRNRPPSSEHLPSQPLARGKQLVLWLRVGVTVASLAYLAWLVPVASVLGRVQASDPGWLAVALGVALVQIPLVAWRWGLIVNGICREGEPLPLRQAVVITSIGVFFGQVLPNIAGDAVRVWLLSRTGRHVADGLGSVLLDRAVAIYVLVAMSALALSAPGAFALAEAPRVFLVAALTALLVTGALGAALAPVLARLLGQYRTTRLLVGPMLGVHSLLLKSAVGPIALALAVAVHSLTIIVILAVGSAVGVPLSIYEAAALFAIMMGVALIPITVGGWGIREITVASLLGSHGVASESTLALSISFGLVLLAASLPGGLAYLAYSPCNRPAEGLDVTHDAVLR